MELQYYNKIWIIFSAIIGFVVLIISIYHNHRKKKFKSLTSCSLFFIANSIIGILILGIGPFIQAIFYNALTHGISLSMISIDEFIRKEGLLLLWEFLKFGLFPGIITSVIAAEGKTRYQSIILGCITAVITLSICDVIFYILYASLSPISFSIFSNVIGGIIAGVVIGIFANTLIDLDSNKKIFTIGFAGIFVFSLIILCSYLLFFYHIPTRVVLKIENWERIEFHYVGNITTEYIENIDVVEIPFIAERVQSNVLGSYLDFSWNFAEKYDEGKMSTSIKIATQQETMSSLERAQFWKRNFHEIFEKMKIIHKDQVAEGQIRVDGGNLNLLIINEFSKNEAGLHPNLILRIPAKRRILLSRGELVFFQELGPSILFKTQQAKNNLLRIEVQGGGLWLGVFSKDRVALIPNATGLVSSSSKETDSNVKIKLPNKVLNIERRYSSDPLVMIVLGSKDGEKHVNFSIPVNILECANCVYRLESANGWPTLVGDFFVRNPKGELRVGATKYELSSGDVLFISGEQLGISDKVKGTITLEGKSSHVILNGNVFTSSIWSSIPIEVQAVIIAGLLALIVGYTRRFLYKRKHKSG